METIMQDFRRRKITWLMAGVVGAALLAASGVARPDDDDNRGRGMREAKKRKPDDVVQSPFRHAPRPIIGALREPLEKLPQIENFKVLAYNPLAHFGGTIARGRNGPTGISGN